MSCAIDIAKILIVDDRPENLFSLEKIFEKFDVEIVRANSGNEALNKVLHHDFSLILLDVQMPEMDGYEVAETLHYSDEFRDIPIIFITAIDRGESYKLKGYEHGAVDYIYKPINPDILRSKVNVFLRLHNQQKSLEVNQKNLIESNHKLELANEKLYNFAHMAAHDLKSPISTVYALLQMLGKIQNADEDKKEMLVEKALASSKRMMSLIDSMLKFSKLSEIKYVPEEVNLNELIDKVSQDLQDKISARNAKVIYSELPVVTSSIDYLYPVFLNIIANSIKFVDMDKCPEVQISSELNEKDGNVLILIKDNGIGIKEKNWQDIFEPFIRCTSNDDFPGSGIGLATVKTLLNQLHGNIRVLKSDELGSLFEVLLPKEKAE